MKDVWKKIPSEEVRKFLKRVDVEESYFKEVADELGETVFGQEEACQAVARMVTRFEAGLALPNKPAGVVMFLGPTGVGKTEMSRALARRMFNDPDSEQLMIIDCAEYSESHTIFRFLGSPPSYVGYGDELKISEEFLCKRNIIVFDEIEKADPALWQMLLSVFATGSLSVRTNDGEKRGSSEMELDFGYSFIILTSNVGAFDMQKAGKGLGFANKSERLDIKQAAMNGLKEHFGRMPEFLGRIDEKIVFKPLTDDDYEHIYWKFISEINDFLRSGISFTTSAELTEYLINLSVSNKQYGARDMEHVIKEVLLQPLSDVLVMEPDTEFIVGDLDENDEVVFYMKPRKPKKNPCNESA